MNMKTPVCGGLIVLAVALVPQIVRAQSFTNLNFESTNIPVSAEPNSMIPMGEAIPGWTGYFISNTATNQAPQTLYDGIPISGNSISIVDANVGFGFNPIVGNYSVFLCGGFTGHGTRYATQISQSALVPVGTKSIQFYAISYDLPVIVTLGSQAIDISPLQMFSNYTLYGGDIPSSLAGQIETLSFTEPSQPYPYPSSTKFELDNIVFSPSSIPEPSILGLLGLGGLAFFWHRRKAADA
jgi:hypothetical protein